ncbi:MAG TPA: tetratricopeptide repeat protein [Terriglobales bacterium]|nr:tetratricopeptide repeat protein [Terriglobales bacterium]
MENELPQPSTASGWRASHVYTLAMVCLVVGLGVGYLLRGSQSPVPAPATPAAAAANPHGAMTEASTPPPTLDQMKHMAEKTAEPFLEKLKKDPNNPELLNQVGNLYRATHQFKEAAAYYEKALSADPKNAAIRTDLASCLYYSGDIDGSIAQLEKALTYNPKFAGALFNLGIIRWKGKNDSAGAVATWEKLLKVTDDPQQKEKLEHLIAQVKQTQPT